MLPPIEPPPRILEAIQTPWKLTIFHRGPPLEYGPLPALFYFSLSGEESLTLDPYNQTVAFLMQAPIRVFSWNLPAHGNNQDNRTAMSRWAQKIVEQDDFVGAFAESSHKAIDFLEEQGYLETEHLAVAGLSRGGYIAVHLAARDNRLRNILGYAPMTDLMALSEFQGLADHPLVQGLSLMHLLEKLADKRIRFYIGNRDIQVGTKQCFDLIHALTEAAYAKGHRSPPVELIISPSIGHKGHGTSSKIFLDGAKWIQSILGIVK
jgi:Prolyl oligopeptidase family